VDAEAFALDLAHRIRRAVVPLLGRPDSRRHAGTAPGGDTTYAIDEVAERVAEEAFADQEDVAYFTEDAGLILRGRPDAFFLVDPIDGTRPSTAGFETCCVTLAVAPHGTAPDLGDVTYGCIVEITTGAGFDARRGAGARAEGRSLAPSQAKELDGLFWAGGFRGQPAVPLAAVMAGIFDVAGARGAFYDQGSAAYSLSRLATGQLDAYVRSLNADGSLLLYGDRPMEVWDVSAGEVVASYGRHAGGSWYASFAPSGSTIFSTGRDATLRHWTANGADELGVYSGLASGLPTVADSGVVLVTDFDSRAAFLVDPRPRGEMNGVEVCRGFVPAGTLNAVAGVGSVVVGCDEGWSSVTDTWHQSIEDAKYQAEFEYEGVGRVMMKASFTSYISS
jgi:fructose-1,6-bisphosphatase/inositol monophosphatase family enzyme